MRMEVIWTKTSIIFFSSCDNCDILFVTLFLRGEKLRSETPIGT